MNTTTKSIDSLAGTEVRQGDIKSASPIDASSSYLDETNDFVVGVQQRQSDRSGKSSGAFRTISEVADELGVQQHVLRFWETKFSHVRPLKRGGGRRYYRPEDVALLKKIHHLLYTEGYTIKGVQKLLRELGKNQVLKGIADTVIVQKAPEVTGSENIDKVEPILMAEAHSIVPPVPANAGLTDNQKTALQGMLQELRELRNIIKPRKQD